MSAGDSRISALATVGELTATVVHEIKGPLAIADGYIQLLQGQLRDDRYRDICRKVRSQLEHIDHLVQGLLYVARAPRPNRRLCRTEEIMSNAISLIRATAQARGVEIRVSRLSQTPEIHADPGQISQVILNVLLNALEAMPQGGIIWIRLRYAESSQSVVLTVADNGPGIAQDIKHRIFEPFVTTKEGGTGLGLAICRNIVGRHGGSIRIRSNKKGTVVRVTLPISAALTAGSGGEEALPVAGR